MVSVTRAARQTEAPAVANQLHAVLVHSDQADWVHVGENATVESTGSHLTGQNWLNCDPVHIFINEDTSNTVITDLAIHVGNATVALSCSIELANLRHLKTFCEGLPHTGAQSISHCQPNFVAFLRWPYWLRQEVAANFPDILHHLRRESSLVIVAVLVHN